MSRASKVFTFGSASSSLLGGGSFLFDSNRVYGEGEGPVLALQDDSDMNLQQRNPEAFVIEDYRVGLG